MPDKRFFARSASLTLEKIAELTGAELPDGADPGFLIEDVAPLDKAGPSDISFLDNVKYKNAFMCTKAGVCLVSPDMAEFVPENTVALVTAFPYKAYAHIAGVFYPSQRPDAYISQHCFIDETADVGRDCTIEHGVVIGPDVQIGDGCWIEPNAVIGRGVIIGKECRIGANASLECCFVGNNVRLYPGVRIGQDGFGFAIDPNGHVKVPQLGRVIIEDKCEIGAGTCIDRGAGPDTVIGEGTWIDNLVQIGHNVRIGKGCIIVAQAGVAGSSVLEDYVVLGGQVGIAGHLNIAKGTRVAAQSGIMRDTEPGQELMGYPAVPIKSFMRQIALLKKMTGKKDQ
jgi:UDP-3-O-[3-hydroxymyristoyl] glucosamine N-acyltransferase